MKSLVRLTLTLALAAVLTTGLFANGLNLNGFGARATAMGGAYVSLANDYTAVFWNPAGLALLKQPTLGLAGDILIPSSSYALGAFTMDTNKKYYPAGLVGYFQPIGDRVVVGVGAFTLSGLGASWNNMGVEAATLAALGLPPAALVPGGTITTYKWESFIASISLAPSIAVQLTDQLYLGAAVNINYGFFQMDRWAGVMYVNPPGFYFNPGQQTLDVKGWGFGATVGLLYKPVEQVSIGVTYRTQAKMKMSGSLDMTNMAVLGMATSSGTKMDVTSPMWLAGGISVKPVPELTLSFDAHYTNWAKVDSIPLTFDDPDWSENLAGEALEMRWKDKIQLRSGVEYSFGKLAIRGGYYYDPAPAPDETLNVLVPSFTFNSIAGGFGYKSGGFTLDIGFEYLMGKDRTVAAAFDDEGGLMNMPGHYEMKILVPVIGLSYAF
jgi:long-chain fatty acid transport protein